MTSIADSPILALLRHLLLFLTVVILTEARSSIHPSASVSSSVPPSSLSLRIMTTSSPSPPTNDTSDSNPSDLTRRRYVVFSDVDGTLVHYPPHLELNNGGDDDDDGNDGSDGDGGGNDDEILRLPPSKTGTRGEISARTLQLCGKLRRRGTNNNTPLVLVSGMRTSTLFQRLPYLPRADAYACESGGRVFYPQPVVANDADDDDDSTNEAVIVRPIPFAGAAPPDLEPYILQEDMERRSAMASISGTDGYDDAIPPLERVGKLWDHARTLTKRGYVVDARGYATSFRINRKLQDPKLFAAEAPFDFDAFVESSSRGEGVPEGLACSTNLGCVDFYPRVSGKKHCCEYLVRKLLRNDDGTSDNDHRDGSNHVDNDDAATTATLSENALCMCDDDNDLEMALACRRAYFPSITSESVRRTVDDVADGGKDPQGKLVVTENTERGIVETKSTEAALELVLEEIWRRRRE